MYDFEACPSGQKRPIGIFVFQFFMVVSFEHQNS